MIASHDVSWNAEDLLALSTTGNLTSERMTVAETDFV